MFYELTYSPDDAETRGKGWYAKIIDPTSAKEINESDLFETRDLAVRWARDNGGVRLLSEHA